MKLKRLLRAEMYGLRGWFGRTIIASAAISVLIFCALHWGVNAFLAHRYASRNLIEKRTQSLVADLQNYITEHDIGTDNLKDLEDWKMRQPVVMLQFFQGDSWIYSSADPDGLYALPVEIPSDNDTKLYPLTLRDAEVQALVYADFSFQHYTLAMIIEGCLCFLIFIVLFIRSTSELITYILRLTNDVQILEGGDLNYEVSVQGNNELTDLANSMNSMRCAFLAQVRQEAELQEANRRLITEMSHDLRTPLTSLLLYTEILRSGRYSGEEQLKEYLNKIDAKAQQMKLLSDNLFEYSLDRDSRRANESTGQEMEPVLRRHVEDAVTYLTANGFSVETMLEWRACHITINRDSAFRISDNICSNVVKYAEKSAPVIISTVYTDRYAGISVLNTLSPQRKGRSGTRIGLDSIRAMMKEMNGICNVEQTDTSFEITVLFEMC